MANMPEKEGTRRKGFRAGKMPGPSKYEPKAEDIKDPFQREFLQQPKMIQRGQIR